MKYLIAFVLILLFAFPAEAQRIRRLLIFADDSTNVQMNQQRKWLEAERQEVEARDIWIAVFHDPKTFRRMYEHYDVGRALFYLILIDKGGDVKLRSEEPVPAKTLFELIDSIPMPQAENRVREGGG